MLGLFSRKQSEDSSSDAYEKELCAHIKQKVEEITHSTSRQSQESTWMTNIAYMCGIDGVSFDPKMRAFHPVDRRENYVKLNRLHVNLILPTIQNRLARLCKNPPRFDVRPESNDSKAKDTARLSLQILKTQWDKLGMDEKRIYLNMWAQQCGHGWLKICWDKTKGEFIDNPETGESDFEGDLRADVVSPFEVFCNPYAKTPEEVRNSWLIQCKVRPLDYFREQYETGHRVKSEDVWLLSAQYDQGIQNLSNKSGTSYNSTESQKNCAIEMVKYEARTKKHPRGRMIVVANGVKLEDKELPVGIIPFAHFTDIVVAGRLYGEAVITHMRPSQDQNNRTIRKCAEWTNSLLAGKMAAARGCGLKKEALNNTTEVLMYDPVPNAPDGGRPTPLPMPMIPEYAYKEQDRHKEYITEISGISQVSKGDMPSASIPAIGMQLLTEQDDTRIGVITTQHESEWAYAAKLILMYVEKYYVTPRKLKLSGPNMGYIVKDITGEMIKGHTDVYVVPGSTKPGSKVLSNQEILNRYDRGLLGDPKDPRVIEKVNEMTEFGDSSEIWQDYGLDMRQIRKGIEMLEGGEIPLINDLDNHALWVQELNRYRKSEKYEELPGEMQIALVKMIETHVDSLLKMTGQTPMEPSPEDILNQPMGPDLALPPGAPPNALVGAV